MHHLTIYLNLLGFKPFGISTHKAEKVLIKNLKLKNIRNICIQFMKSGYLLKIKAENDFRFH